MYLNRIIKYESCANLTAIVRTPVLILLNFVKKLVVFNQPNIALSLTTKAVWLTQKVDQKLAGRLE